MKALFLPFALGLTASLAGAATPPPWLAACLAERAGAQGASTAELVRQKGGAAIELLNSCAVTFLTPDRIHTRRRLAVAVSSEAARAQVPTAEQYNSDNERIVSVDAWTVSADGRRVRHYGRSGLIDTAAQFSSYFWDSERVIRLDPTDKLELGGVVAWEIQTESPVGAFDASFGFRSPRYIVRGEFEVTPAPGATLIWHASSHRLQAPEDAPGGGLLWKVARVPPFPAGRPSGFLPNPLEVSVRCRPNAPGAVFAEDWVAESRLIANVIEPRIEPGGAIKAEADRLVAGQNGNWNRIRALAEFVQREIVYLSITLDKDILAGCRPHPASEVLKNRYGDCKDKATLLVSLLRAEGVAAHVVLVYATDPSAVHPDWPSLGFNHAIVVIPADADVPSWWATTDGGALGKLVVFDPTDPIAPFGTLSPADEGGYGLTVDPARGGLVRFPTASSDLSGLERMAQARLLPDGGVQADVEEVLRGRAALRLYSIRYLGGAREFGRFLENNVHAAAPLESNLTWKDDWEPTASCYRINLEFHAGGFVHAVDEDDEMITPALMPGSVRLLPWTSRAEGVVWLPAEGVRDEINLPLPKGYRVEEMPDPWEGTAGKATGRLTYRVEGGTIMTRIEISRPGGFYAKPEYEALRDFYLKLHEAQRRPILFRRDAAS